MTPDLYGTMRLEPRDVARKAITAALNRPFYRIDATGSWVTFYDEHNNQVNLCNAYGLYALYKDDVCLYVGETFNSIYSRVYRFQKELRGLSRHDENHPGAKKARMDGLESLDGCKVKFIPHDVFMSDVDKIDPEYRQAYGHLSLDEWAAPLLKSKYNTKRGT